MAGSHWTRKMKGLDARPLNWLQFSAISWAPRKETYVKVNRNGRKEGVIQCLCDRWKEWIWVVTTTRKWLSAIIRVRNDDDGKIKVIPKFSYLTLQEKPKTVAGSLHFSDAENELLSECNRNPLSKALLRMHMAGQAVTSQSHVGTERQTQLLKVWCFK